MYFFSLIIVCSLLGSIFLCLFFFRLIFLSSLTPTSTDIGTVFFDFVSKANSTPTLIAATTATFKMNMITTTNSFLPTYLRSLNYQDTINTWIFFFLDIGMSEFPWKPRQAIWPAEYWFV